MVALRFERVLALPSTPIANTIYFVKAPGADTMTMFVAGNDGVPTPLSAGGATPVPGDTTAPVITPVAAYTMSTADMLDIFLTANETVAWSKISGVGSLTGNKLHIMNPPAGDLSTVVRATDAAGNSSQVTISGTATAVVSAPPATPSAINKPTLIKVSEAGAVPFEWKAPVDDTVYAGDIWRLQTSASAEKNADGSYVTPIQNLTKMISPSEFTPGYVADWSTTASPPASGTFVTPSGTFYFQKCVERYTENGTIRSPWGDELTDTIVSATTVMSTATGVNKSRYAVITGTPPLIVSLDRDDVGAPCPSRATQQPTSDLTQFEVTLNALNAGGQTYITVDDGTTNFDLSQLPGQGGRKGVSLICTNAGGEILYNPFSSDPALPMQNGDIISVRINKTTGVISFFRTRAGVTTAFGVPRSYGLTSFYAGFGHNRPASATMNFGQAPFAKPLDGGFVIYG
jgi:hypothetical protein